MSKLSYYVWQTEQKGGYEFDGVMHAGRFYPKNNLGAHDGFGSSEPNVVNVVSHKNGENWVNYGIALFSKQATGKVESFLNCPLVYFNNFIDSSFLLFELFPNYVWEQLDTGLYRFTSYGDGGRVGIVRIKEDYTFAVLGQM